MKRLLSLGAAAAVFGSVILQASPSAGQVLDPCRPIPITGLCPPPAPVPSLTPPSPSPSPSAKKKSRSAKKKQTRTIPRGGPRKLAQTTHQAPFAISGPNSSARVVDLLSQLIPLGMPLEESLREVVGPFPVAGPAWWIDDWHAPRSGGRVHLGLDIFAPHGTPLVAVSAGVVTQKDRGALPGLYVEIRDSAGVEYFYCHLSRWATGIEIGDRVEVGDLLGYVGNTGNAISTPPHVHFEVQPGGVSSPPKPLVDRWVKLAEQRAIALIRRMGGTVPDADDPDAFRLTRMFDLAAEGRSGDPAELLALSGLQPGVSSLEMAGMTVDQMSWEIDWAARANADLAGLIEEHRRTVIAREIAGLTPWPEDPQAHAAPHAGDSFD